MEWKTEGLEGSKTEKNLFAAWKDKSRTKMLYTYFAYAAMHEGYQQLSEFMEESAKNDTMHSKLFYMSLYGPVSDTKTNIKNLLSEKREMHSHILPEYSKTARKEGFGEAATFFEEIAKIDLEHERKYSEILKQLEDASVFSSSEKCEWICAVCGYRALSFEAPDVCTICGHDRRFFSIAK